MSDSRIKLQNVAINNVLSLKAAQRCAMLLTQNVFGSPRHQGPNFDETTTNDATAAHLQSHPFLVSCSFILSLYYAFLIRIIFIYLYTKLSDKTSSSAMAERPRELGDFKKARVNGGTDDLTITLLRVSHKSLRCR